MSKYLFSESLWKRDLWTFRGLRYALEPLGASWVVYEPLTAYIPGLQAVVNPLRPYLLGILALITLLWAASRLAPNLSRRCKIANTDVAVELVVASLFSYIDQGAIVMSTNNSFDTCRDGDLISGETLQGKLTDGYYGSWRDIDSEVQGLLKGRVPDGHFQDDRATNQLYYPMGTTLHLKPKSKTSSTHHHVYLVALTRMSKLGRSNSEIQDLQDALVGLWSFVADEGEHCPITIPLLGTGKARMDLTKEQSIRAIIDSFVAAVSQNNKRFCDLLRIVVNPSDYEKGDVSIEEMGRYLEHVCKYAIKRPEERRSVLVNVSAGSARVSANPITAGSSDQLNESSTEQAEGK